MASLLVIIRRDTDDTLAVLHGVADRYHVDAFAAICERIDVLNGYPPGVAAFYLRREVGDDTAGAATMIGEVIGPTADRLAEDLRRFAASLRVGERQGVAA